MHDLSQQVQTLPAGLAQAAGTAWDAVLENAESHERAPLEALAADARRGPQLARMLACSQYVAALLRRRPGLLLRAAHSGDLDASLPEGSWLQRLGADLAEPAADLAVTLRRFRQYHMLRILWRDFNRLADTLETVRDTSLLAEACVHHALQVCEAQLVERFGRPIGRRSGERQPLIVIAMGKLGARELNVSSDIDLIFAFPEAGQTDGERRPLSNEEFFTRLGRALINTLDTVTADGFVFRVDMRLRPYGESGALVHNFAALEAYYQEQGRDWERYALVKARPITGGAGHSAALMRMLRPFVFRRYVDFGVIDSLRGMKRMLVAEVARRGLDDNVKLGSGGIREIEFIAQCLQLIRGGRDRALQQRELLQVLPSCAELGCLPADVVEELRQAYCFLRDTEHAIQGYADRQTQELPDDALGRAALAEVMAYPDWESFSAALAGHRQRVAAHFNDLIAAPEDAEAEPALAPWNALDASVLSRLGYAEAEDALERLADLRDVTRLRGLQRESRERLEQFMPLLLEACAGVGQPDLALQRILPLVRAVLRRSAYLMLLMENPPALAELVALCEASPWVAELLAAQPVLLDELLDRSSLYSAPDRERLQEELRRQVDRLPLTDLEAQMDALRYFKAAHVLRVAASERLGRLPLMKVSDKLTFIAEVVLEQVLRVAWAQLVSRYGEPARDGEDSGFVIYSYGKLGGIELSYASDLDLVFIYDADASGVTSGERSIDNSVFYTRLGQKVIHILETRMPLGKLYEIDMRLRPSGASGLLVSTLKAFAAYQRDTAWTWEHQALVRARSVAGDRRVAEALDEVRRDILCQPRDAATLAGEVVAMREKMREHLLPTSLGEDRFELKQSPGGIVDIEFMVQYAVLAWSHQMPGLTRWSDNIRILESLGEQGLFSQSVCDALIKAYIAFRSASHQLALQQAKGIVAAADYRQHIDTVQAQWQTVFGGVTALSSSDENK
ncbi:bifunctional [glutamate--ammonia ligase]-adenylyl-L-tyrosine phosphorylase/[glutamate--ammonia-ligase] adenylyltransferase [Chromatocurvus halotolerans]|uniref:Bifunctional glutamine synthetase adenylyltransferase/adenylyl-removing enzyme n=1 Tax=Chromatocurvus halotolerans TaxID=1132028 RepID=A0A4V2SAW4_9GAMM|nr:bifunctional [glutamate--ammonia ligase]-adenylyl-L-tyrosine phosphorylase/[glutamate--ammonia-ligase] adenylyltransferase [Chromatocurvus halotolerans]TCO73200.1 glutamate-ammonia-ligase adenylyltransferase [Chromatocurvus halotolerans]